MEGSIGPSGMGEVALTWTRPGHACPAVGAGQPGGCQPPQSPASSLCPPARDQHRLGSARLSPSPHPEATAPRIRTYLSQPAVSSSLRWLQATKARMGRALDLLEFWEYRHPPLSTGDAFQDPQWMPKNVDNTDLYIDHVFPYIHTLMIKFNL